MIPYILLGLLAGIFGGVFGIGGATVIIPALVYLGGFSQHSAQGTMIAMMIPPIGLLAAIKYYQSGNVNIKVAMLLAIGFFIGGLIGAILADKISEPVLKKAFGVFLGIIAIKMILGK